MLGGSARPEHQDVGGNSNGKPRGAAPVLPKAKKTSPTMTPSSGMHTARVMSRGVALVAIARDLLGDAGEPLGAAMIMVEPT